MGFLCGFSGEGYSQVSKLLCKWQIVLVFSFKYLLKTDNWVLIYSLALAIPTCLSHLLSIYRPLSSWRGKFSENFNSECDIYIFLLSLKLDNGVLCFLTKQENINATECTGESIWKQKICMWIWRVSQSLLKMWFPEKVKNMFPVNTWLSPSDGAQEQLLGVSFSSRQTLRYNTKEKSPLQDKVRWAF